jgi:DNA-binding beta-propeller fold protein YncE
VESMRRWRRMKFWTWRVPMRLPRPAGLIRARAWRILSETAPLVIYRLLFAWNILNVRFVMRVIALLVFLVTLSLVQPLTAQTAASCAPAGNIQFVCGQEAPEDLLHLPGSDWVIASSMAGNGGIRLIGVRDKTSTLLYPSSSAKEQLDRKTYDTCPGAPEPDDKAKFTTHGLAMRAARNSIYTLYAVHHGKRESIEVFQVNARSKTPVLTWIGCAIAPDPIGLNSVVPLPGGGFVATNFLERGANASAARTKMMAGENNGELWEWHTGKGWRKVPGSEAAGANGVEVSKDGKWLYVAAWGSQSFLRLSRGQTPVKRDTVPLGFRVDNIRFAPDGSILAAGQGQQTTNVVRVDPETLKITELINQPNTESFASGTVAIPIGNDLWVGSFRGDRIAIFPASK